MCKIIGWNKFQNEVTLRNSVDGKRNFKEEIVSMNDGIFGTQTWAYANRLEMGWSEICLIIYFKFGLNTIALDFDGSAMI